ncbi:MAG: glycosyltransferase family A protein [Pseudomonadota bacterium]|nr:glycosyltransferase family A protein [Pseudomonadota bacterium]
MKYNITMFAYNESENIQASIESVWQNTDTGLGTFHLVANGCTDDTVTKAHEIKSLLSFDKLSITELTIGDKCNAWNHYMHELADGADIHFFVDADVLFSACCFQKMASKLYSTSPETVAIAGLPLSGRNQVFYESLVTERSCLFGNLYGLKGTFIKHIKQSEFRLPQGLNWIDSFITKAVNTNLDFKPRNLPNRVTHLPGAGYNFVSLSPLKVSDLILYKNRIARYELGKMQEFYLDAIPVSKWPNDLDEINLKIFNNFSTHSDSIPIYKKIVVKQRLKKLIKEASHNE